MIISRFMFCNEHSGQAVSLPRVGAMIGYPSWFLEWANAKCPQSSAAQDVHLPGVSSAEPSACICAASCSEAASVITQELLPELLPKNCVSQVRYFMISSVRLAAVRAARLNGPVTVARDPALRWPSPEPICIYPRRAQAQHGKRDLRVSQRDQAAPAMIGQSVTVPLCVPESRV